MGGASPLNCSPEILIERKRRFHNTLSAIRQQHLLLSDWLTVDVTLSPDAAAGCGLSWLLLLEDLRKEKVTASERRFECPGSWWVINPRPWGLSSASIRRVTPQTECPSWRPYRILNTKDQTPETDVWTEICLDLGFQRTTSFHLGYFSTRTKIVENPKFSFWQLDGQVLCFTSGEVISF